ncbi:RNA-directed DNA polymerase, eukaryota [Tanacetum coccineum]
MKQNEEEWVEYQKTMENVIAMSGLDKSVFYDLRGNHDNFGVPVVGGAFDYFSNYSITGQLGRTVEPFILSAHTQLSAMHPIYKLLDPRMRYTLEIACQNLLNADGVIEQGFTPGRYYMEISAAAYKHWRFDLEGLPTDLIRRYLFKWKNIIREVQSLKSQGVDLLSHCRIRVGNGYRTRKLNGSVFDSFHRNARGGVEEHQLAQLRLLIDPIILSSSEDRWVWELNSDGGFHVKDIRRLLDEFFLPKVDVATRWIKSHPLQRRRVSLKGNVTSVPSLLCRLFQFSDDMYPLLWLLMCLVSFADGGTWLGLSLFRTRSGLIGSSLFVVKEALLTTVEKGAGEKCCEEMKGAWSEAYD